MKKYQFLSATLFGLASFAVATSCSKKKTEEVKAKIEGKVEQNEEKKDLQGNFRSDGKNQLSIVTQGVGCVAHEIQVSGNKMNIIQTTFAETDCRGEALGKIVTETEMKVGQELTVAPGARALDLKIVKIDVMPLKDNFGTVFGVDVTGDCDIDDLAVNTAKDVSGLNCGVLGKFPASGQTYFTAYRLVNDKTLEFTKLPQESLNNVGSEAAPAPRNQSLVTNYYRQ